MGVTATVGIGRLDGRGNQFRKGRKKSQTIVDKAELGSYPSDEIRPKMFWISLVCLG